MAAVEAVGEATWSLQFSKGVFHASAILDPRRNWKKRSVEEYGLLYHTINNEPRIGMGPACYQFTTYEVDRIEEATNALHDDVSNSFKK